MSGKNDIRLWADNLAEVLDAAAICAELFNVSGVLTKLPGWARRDDGEPLFDEIAKRARAALRSLNGELAFDAEWSGPGPIPAVGEIVHVAMNGFGPAKVLGYKVVEGYIAVMVEFLEPPDWWLRQNKEGRRVGADGGNPPGCIFGAELARKQS